MTETVRVELNPELLVWARTTAGFSLSDIARLFKTEEETVMAWETGQKRLTFRQLEKFANKVKRPLAAFFLPDPPEEPKLPRDYRVLSGKQPDLFESATLLAFREARNILEETTELQVALGYEKLTLSLPIFSLSDNPEEKAFEIRQRFNVPVMQQVGWSSINQALNYWRNILFDHGILVVTLPFPLTDARGFSIEDNDAAVIGLSTKDAYEGRIFTLFHELCHLCLGKPGVSGGKDRQNHFHSMEYNQKLERYCDRFSAAFMMPFSNPDVTERLENLSRKLPLDRDAVISSARTLKVSKYALLRRMLDGAYIDETIYWRAFDFWQECDRNEPLKKKKSGGHQIKTNFSEKGKRYVSLVMEALDGGYITYRDASSYLSVAPKWFEDARKYAG